MNVMKQFRDGLFFQNPVTVQLLGMCSVMAITTTLFNGLGMGLSVLVILTLSNIIIAALRKIIPNNIRIACFIVVIAGFVTIVDLCLQAFIPALSKSLGLFIPLIVVNCIILGRAVAACQRMVSASLTVSSRACRRSWCWSSCVWFASSLEMAPLWAACWRSAQKDSWSSALGTAAWYPHPARGHSTLWA